MTNGSSAGEELRDAARTARDSPALEVLGRVGFGASALLQVLLGVLAIRLGVDNVVEADQSGALQEVADAPGGFIILWVSAAGFLSLTVWLVIRAALIRSSSAAQRWRRRIEDLGKAAAYTALGLTALAFAVGQRTSASAMTREFSAGVLSLPGGPVLLVLVGLIAIGVGVFCVVKGVRRRFTKDIDLPTGALRVGVLALGIVGYTAKGLVIGVAGVLFIVAAITVRPDNASGFAGALGSLAQLPLGPVVLFVVGAGLIASGAYNAARTKLARF